MAVIRFENVFKSYGDHDALKALSLEIGEGERVALIGPSGCGKTTLLRLVNAMETKTSGRLEVYGKSIEAWDPIRLRRQIGYVIQHTGLFPHLRVWENIGYVMSLGGERPARIRTRAAELVRMVNLPESYLDRYPRQLSGGEKQRVGVARALATDPQLILMDEPFGAVDEINRRILQDELLALQQQLKTTIVFVTHDIEEAMRVGSRIVLMDQGEIVGEGPRRDMLFSDNRYVQSFFGSKDFLSYINITPIAEVMEKDDIMGEATVSMHDPIASGLKLLLRSGAEFLTVLDDGHKPVGRFGMRHLKSL